MTKSQFYAFWIILGLAAWIGFSQTVELFTQLVISLGIEYDAPPVLVKYFRLFVYVIVWIILIVITARIIREKGPQAESYQLKRPRLTLVILLAAGFVSRLITQSLEEVRREKLINFMERHDLTIQEFMPGFSIPGVLATLLIFITAIVVFFIITGKTEGYHAE